VLIVISAHSVDLFGNNIFDSFILSISFLLIVTTSIYVLLCCGTSLKACKESALRTVHKLLKYHAYSNLDLLYTNFIHVNVKGTVVQ